MPNIKDVPVVVYRYAGSPFGDKADSALAMKSIPHFKVEQPMTMPRPDLSELLGVTYRRIPVIAIGKDVYVDTSLIIPVLERQFTNSDGFTTLFPPRKGGGSVDTGLMKALAMYYADRIVFPLGAASLPWKKFAPEFIADRSAWQGTKMDVEKMVARQPLVKSQIVSHLTLLEEQLSDGREWLFDTETPGFGDLSLHFIYSWLVRFRDLKEMIATFPKSSAWIKRVSKYIESKKKTIIGSCRDIKGEEAANLIEGSDYTEEVNFDDAEAQRLNLTRDSQVSVTPDDNAKDYPTSGKLVGLDPEQIVIETSGSVAKNVRVHFPRLNFIVKSADEGKTNLSSRL